MIEVLPIKWHREEIIEAVKAHRVVIIKAETGAGKSTQVPQFLLECAPKVVVIQPRRLATTSIAQRIAKEMKCAVGGLVGYRTASDSKESEATRLVICTDGLELVRQILGGHIPEGVLVIDEVHEWSLNLEMLVAWARHQLKRGADYKVVIMSATIEPEVLCVYFEDAVVVNVPGRTFPVEERSRRESVVADAAALLNEGRNVLVFQPGKVQINRTVAALKAMKLDAEVFPLYGKMSEEEQRLCFGDYLLPKCIVATNIAQTSLTIPGIDAVVDSGLERRGECVDGVEGLYIRPISLVDREQRKGRAGRTKPGIYVDACPVPREQRLTFPVPDITRLPMERVVLQLALAGQRTEDVTFFHQPTPAHIARARWTLRQLGCIEGDGQLTAVGKRVARLPVSPRFGRMLVEAEDRHVLSAMITLVSIMEQGKITKGTTVAKKGVGDVSWSDALVQLAAFNEARNLKDEELEGVGIDAQAFSDALETRKRLTTALSRSLKHYGPLQHDEYDEKHLVSSLYAGLVDCLYKRSVLDGYKDLAGNIRQLPGGSVVAGAQWIVGIPWSLQMRSAMGPRTLRLITVATRVDLTLLKQVAPHLVEVREGRGTVCTYFNETLISEERR